MLVGILAGRVEPVPIFQNIAKLGKIKRDVEVSLFLLHLFPFPLFPSPSSFFLSSLFPLLRPLPLPSSSLLPLPSLSPPLAMFSSGSLSRTPNPDISCNREIKFKSLYHHAFGKMKADFLATGTIFSLVLLLFLVLTPQRTLCSGWLAWRHYWTWPKACPPDSWGQQQRPVLLSCWHLRWWEK